MRMKTACTCFLTAAILGGVSCRRVLEDVVPVVGLDFTRSSIVSGSGADSSTTAADDEELVKAVEYDDTITVVSPIEVGELLCDTLVQAEDAAILSFVLLGNENIIAEKTFYTASNGNAFSDGIGRKVWMGTVTDPGQGEDEAVPRTVSMAWGNVCNTETFLLKVTKQSTDGTTTIVKTFPCHGSTTQTCMVEVEVEIKEPNAGIALTNDAVIANSTNGFGFERNSKEDTDTDANPTIVSIPSDRRLQNSENTVIDVIVMYTAESLNVVNTISSQMETILWASMARTNEAFVNSEIELTMNVVYMAQLPYSQGSFNINDFLSAIRVFDYVTNLRDERGADLVQLIGGFTPLEYCGLGYLHGFGSTYGFSVVDAICLDGYSESHEYGHNLGCDHNREDANTATAYAHGMRYCSGSDPYRTMMSYPCTFYVSRINYYSNPDVIYLDKPTGTSTENCALAIKNNMVSISNYRESVTETTPSSYTLVGCYGDSIRNRVLSGPSSKGDPTMTTEVCAAFCKEFRYFGTEYSSECFCGLESDDPTELGAATCSYTCAGDSSQTCGGSFAVSVYEHEPVVAPGYLGCWADSSPGRVMDERWLSPSMTNDLCEEICVDFSFYATQYGEECWCGDASTDYTLYGESTSCNMPCVGDTGTVCGGRYAMSVWETQ